MLHDHLLLARLSSFSFGENVIVLGPNAAGRFVGQAVNRSRGRRGDIVRQRARAAVEKGWTDNANGVTVIFAVNMLQVHWSAFYAVLSHRGVQRERERFGLLGR